MSRLIFAFVFIFAAIFVAAYMLMEQASRPASSSKPTSGTELAKSDDASVNKEDESASPTSAGNLEEPKSTNPKSDESAKVKEDKNGVKNIAAEPKPDEPAVSTRGQRKQKSKQTVVRSAPAMPSFTP